MRKADPRILGVPLRIVRGEDCALQALQADFAAVRLQGVQQTGPVKLVLAGVVMGQVAVVMKIMPEDMGQFDKLKSDVVSALKPYKLEEQPVAFGIVALSLTFVVEDGVGGSDLLEEKANKIANVSGVEIVSVDRL